MEPLARTREAFHSMLITSASLLDFPALRRLEQACFKNDAWSFLDLIAVLNEFHEEAIVPMLEDFTDLAEQEAEKEQEANVWYEENIER